MDIGEFKKRAALVAYLRTFTNLPYSHEIIQEANLLTVIKEHLADGQTEVESEAPRFEIRYKSISKLIELRGTGQIIELAAGFSPRGLIMTENPLIQYVETDLEPTINEKKRVVTNILKSKGVQRSNLSLMNVDVFNKDELENAAATIPGPVTIVHEGLLAYFRFDEIKIIAQNIRSVLASRGGVWITPDFTTVEYRRKLNQNVIQIFSGDDERDSIKENAFKNDAQIAELFAETGFSAEIYLPGDLVNNSVSAAIANIDQSKYETELRERKVYCLSVK